jgi:hypothetical protein
VRTLNLNGGEGKIKYITRKTSLESVMKGDYFVDVGL